MLTALAKFCHVIFNKQLLQVSLSVKRLGSINSLLILEHEKQEAANTKVLNAGVSFVLVPKFYVSKF